MTKRKPPQLPVPATGFYSTARHNLEGAKRIARTLASEEERNRNPCIQFLLGWAVEGFLKTYLAEGGMSDRDLRVCIGHDLDGGLRVAVAKGLVVTGAEQLGFVVGHLAPAHLGMFWRYLPTNQDGTERGFTPVMPYLNPVQFESRSWPGLAGEPGMTI